MKEFLKEKVKWERFELLIDSKIFSKDIVIKAAYNYLDKGYFFFNLDWDKNIILQFTKKDWVKEKPENIIWDFYDELLSVYLRDKLEKDNKDIREKIVWAAIANSLQTADFVEINTDDCSCDDQNQIDFDKDIDEILKEIENDPELKIDEDEIERILKEIEAETSSDWKSNEPAKKNSKGWKNNLLDNNFEDIINSLDESKLKIDEDEIEKIMKEIEKEDKEQIIVDVDAVKEVKKKFNNSKKPQAKKKK